MIFESDGNIQGRWSWTATREVYNASKTTGDPSDQRQMYLILEQSVRMMRYLRVRRKNREWFGGASFRRIESTDSLWIRASVVYCKPENERL